MKKSGFTLAELVITLSIIGVAAALAAPALSSIMPDKDKVKILKYNALLGNAVNDILSDEDLYHPYTTYNAQGNPVPSCEGLACVPNCDTEIKNRVGVSGTTGPDNSQWTFDGSSADGYTVTIDVDRNKAGCSYSQDCASRNVDTFIFRIDKYGAIAPGDALTDAFLRNPLNVNSRKEDIESAKQLLTQKTY